MSQIQKSHTKYPFFLKSKLVYSVFILISFLFYGNSLKNGYSMDDELATSTYRQEHPVVSKGWYGVKDAFFSHYAQDGTQKYAYRPITTVSFAIEYALFKNHPNRAGISHFISVFLHGLCGLLLFVLLQTLFFGKAKWFSFIVAVVFLIHPIHSEVVNNIKTRDELLAFLFGMSSVIAVLRYMDTRKLVWLFLTPVLLAFAMLSKETGNVFVAIIPLALFFFRDFSWKRIMIWTLIIGLVYLIIRKVSMNMVEEDTVRIFHFFENPLYDLGFANRIPMFFYSILLYVSLLLFPYPLRFYYGYDQISIVNFSDWQFIVAFLIVGGLLWVTLRGFLARNLVSFGILFFFLAIGGASNLLFPIPGIIGERLAFIASAGFAIAIVSVVFRLLKLEPTSDEVTPKMNYVIIGMTIFALPSFLYSFKRNQDWDSALTLYRADIVHLPKSMKAHSLLATEYANNAFSLQRTGNMDNYIVIQEYGDSAIAHYMSALSIYSHYANTYNNISVLYFNIKADVQKSIEFSHKALKLDSSYSEAWYNLANNHAKIHKNLDEIRTFLDIESTKFAQGQSGYFRYDKFLEGLLDNGLLRAWELLNQIENAYKSVYSSPQNIPMTRSFFSFVDHVASTEGRFLIEMNLGEELKKSAQFSFDIQRKHNGNVIILARKRLIEQMKSSLENELFETYLIQGIRFQSAQFYTCFDNLYKVDPNYGMQYTSVSSFAAAERNFDQLMVWGRRLSESHPNQSHQAFSQIGFVHKELGQLDSARFYFEQAMLKKAELIKSLGKPVTDSERNQKNQLNQELVRIQQVLTELNVPE